MMIDIEKIGNLRFENEREYLGENKPVNSMCPVLSVIVETYQHEKYIKACIEGILMQKTDFDFEIIIGEDGSDDGTREICIDFAERYPHKIRLFLRSRETSQLYDENGNYIFRFNALWNHMAARGKYIAWCEGDDYWTDSEKLQKQVNVLEEKPEYSLCFHNAKVVYENSDRRSHIFANFTKNEYDIYDLISNPWFIPTQSIVFKKEDYDSPLWAKMVSGPDYAFQLRLATKGNLFAINDIMSVYRKHDGGVSANQPTNYSSLKKIETLSYFNLISDFRYNSVIQEKIKEICKVIYINELYSRPLFSKLLSIDYYIFKSANFTKRFVKRKIV